MVNPQKGNMKMTCGFTGNSSDDLIHPAHGGRSPPPSLGNNVNARIM